MDWISHMPSEILFHILECNILSIEDVGKFCQTNSKFISFLRNNLLWMKKYYQKSVTASKKHSPSKKRELVRNVNFSKILIPIMKKMHTFDNILTRSYHLTQIEEQELVRIIKLASDTAFGYYYYRDEFNRIFLDAERSSNCGKAYLARLMMYYLGLHKFIRDQNRILTLKKNKVSFEKQIVVVLQFLQPTISLSEVKLWINNITESILRKLSDTYKTRSFAFKSIETFRSSIVFRETYDVYDHENDVVSDIWSIEQLDEIMHRIEKFVFKEIDWKNCPLTFNEECIETLETTSSFDRIPRYISIHFQRALPVITHYFIANKLGINCRLKFIRERTDAIGIEWTLKVPSQNWTIKSLKRIKESKDDDDDDDEDDRLKAATASVSGDSTDNNNDYSVNENYVQIFVDVRQEKRLFLIRRTYKYFSFLTTTAEYPYNLTRNNDIESNILTINQFVNNLQVLDGLVCFLKSIVVKNRNDENSCHFYLAFSHLTDLLWRCTNISDYNIILEHQRFSSEMMVRLKVDRFDILSTAIRQTRIKFAIGMIVVHWRNSYLNAHKGVILGWHHNYRQAFVDKMMDFNIRQISSACDGYRFHQCHIRTHPTAMNRPYYIILTEDSGLCYVQQERIRLGEPSEILNPELGRYFSHFNGLFYVPNENMKRNYPKDLDYLNETFYDYMENGEKFDILRLSVKLGTTLNYCG